MNKNVSNKTFIYLKRNNISVSGEEGERLFLKMLAIKYFLTSTVVPTTFLLRFLFSLLFYFPHYVFYNLWQVM